MTGRQGQPGLVSLIVPVYNGEAFLEEALESLLGQTHRQIELVVIDDGSTDRTAEILAGMDDPRLRVHRQPNRGVADACNTGLSAAEGEFILLQAADDVSLPHRVETLLRALQRAPDAGFAHSDMLVTDGAGCPIGYWQAEPVERENVLPFMLRVGTPFNNGTILFRRSAIGDHRYDPDLRLGEDSLFVSRVAAGWPGIYVGQPLMLYRRHADNLTANPTLAAELPWIRKLLAVHSLPALVPEAFRGSQPCGAPLAAAVVGLNLARRGFEQEALDWFERAADPGLSARAQSLVGGLLAVAAGDHEAAVDRLAAALPHPVAHNYLGELFARYGDAKAAAESFRRSLLEDPAYDEPLVNLRAMGRAAATQLVDVTWRRFAR